jgi:hypothetical protein
LAEAQDIHLRQTNVFQQFPRGVGQAARPDANAVRRKCAHRSVEADVGVAAAEQRH